MHTQMSALKMTWITRSRARVSAQAVPCHCWAVNRSWLWQEVGITMLPMRPMFIFCLFRQCWLLHTNTHTSQLDLPLHICTHTHTPAAHTQVCTNYRDKKSFVWEPHLTSVYWLKKRKLNAFALVGWGRDEHIHGIYMVCVGVWRGRSCQGPIRPVTCSAGTIYVVEHTLVCACFPPS